jgi:hypothetical protein
VRGWRRRGASRADTAVPAKRCDDHLKPQPMLVGLGMRYRGRAVVYSIQPRCRSIDSAIARPAGFTMSPSQPQYVVNVRNSLGMK